MRARSLLATLLLASAAFATTNQPGEVETVGGVPFTHRFLSTGATSWHYVEGGSPSGEPVIFLAGLPESWFSFHHQMVDLAPTHRVIGIDLFGQTVRPDSESFDRIAIANDLVDVGRTLDPDNDELFTWWAPWRNLRQRNIGWRIDYVLATSTLASRAASSVSRREFGTSDHAPQVVTFTP